MKKYSFIKMSGAGNDFVLFDEKLNGKLNFSGEAIRKICDRRYGIGSDGMIIIKSSPDNDFIMDYFNSDGLPGSLCGNGARCALKYYALDNLKEADRLIKFSANGRDYSGEIKEDGQVKFYLRNPEKIKLNFRIKAAGQLIKASYADTGSPHVVIDIGDVLRNPGVLSSGYTGLDSFPVNDLGREIRYAADFQPSGTNVNFITVLNGKIFIRSYERGVEAETPACGTGSAAAAVISGLQKRVNAPVEIITLSGYSLIVDFKRDDNRVYDVSLTGPALSIFSGEIKEEFF